MAILNPADRADVTAKFVQAFFVQLRKTADLSTDELQTLVNDIDTWMDANTGAANSAISLPVRTKASASTKFAALAYVALKRGGLI